MDIYLEWSDPIELHDARDRLLIYSCDLDLVPDEPGVYVFGRRHGDTVSPLYIGQAHSLSDRIKGHFKHSVPLMRGLEEAESGARILLLGRIRLKPGQNVDRVLNVVERALIEHTVAQDCVLLNVHGTKRVVNTIHSEGNQWTRQFMPLRLKVRDE